MLGDVVGDPGEGRPAHAREDRRLQSGGARDLWRMTWPVRAAVFADRYRRFRQGLHSRVNMSFNARSSAVEPRSRVILPVVAGRDRRTSAVIFSFLAGVILPIANPNRPGFTGK